VVKIREAGPLAERTKGYIEMKTINRIYLAAAFLMALGSVTYIASAKGVHAQLTAPPAAATNFGGNPPPCGPYPLPPCPGSSQQVRPVVEPTSK
jgi:hypothetical protein